MGGATDIPDENIKALYEAMKWVNDFLTDSKWMAGDEVTIADTTMLGTLSTLIVNIIEFIFFYGKKNKNNAIVVGMWHKN